MARKKVVQQSQAIRTIFTIGHSTRTIAEFVALLAQVAVNLLIDVRSIPRSRTNRSSTPTRSPRPSRPLGSLTVICLPSVVCAVEQREQCRRPIHSGGSAAFRNYADYAATDAFRRGLEELRALSRGNCCAIMCAEAVWWRCHRRIIADYLLAEGIPVAHIMGLNKIDLAEPTPGVWSLPGGTLVYPTAEDKAIS